MSKTNRYSNTFRNHRLDSMRKSVWPLKWSILQTNSILNPSTCFDCTSNQGSYLKLFYVFVWYQIIIKIDVVVSALIIVSIVIILRVVIIIPESYIDMQVIRGRKKCKWNEMRPNILRFSKRIYRDKSWLRCYRYQMKHTLRWEHRKTALLNLVWATKQQKAERQNRGRSSRRVLGTCRQKVKAKKSLPKIPNDSIYTWIPN